MPVWTINNMRVIKVSTWKVLVQGKAVEELDSLPLDIQARFQRLFDLIEDLGKAALTMPHARHIHGPLWELRVRGRDGIARGLYVAVARDKVVVVRFFVKKTQKTPIQEIRLALGRVKEYEDDRSKENS